MPALGFAIPQLAIRPPIVGTPARALRNSQGGFVRNASGGLVLRSVS